jgi:hypothetical protein
MATTKKAGGKKSAAKKASSKTSSKKSAGKKKPTPRPRPGLVRCEDWTAIHDFMPPRKPTLRVSGVCHAPTPGYRIRLEETRGGINPLILFLRKVVTPPTGRRPQVMTPVKVRWSKRTAVKYTHVQIQPEGTLIEVQNVT